MAERITIDIDILKGVFTDVAALKASFTSVEGVLKHMEKSMGEGMGEMRKNLAGMTAGVGGVNKNLERTRAIDISAISNSFVNLKDRLNEVTQPGVAFDTQMHDLEAITGVTGAALDNLGERARALAKTYGGEAATGVETFKLLISQLGPEIAKQPDVLEEMARQATLLSKTMKGDLVGATEALTTSMNQYGVDINNPIAAQAAMTRITNVLAAAAKEGSAEVPALKEGMAAVGGAAKAAGVNFELTAAALEQLDKAGKKSAEGGVALRNVLGRLAEGRFMPERSRKALELAGIDVAKLGDNSIKATDRLRMLRPILADTALMSQLFGVENELAGRALVQNADAIDTMAAKITGTTVVQEQANAVMSSWSEKMSRMKAQISDWGISIFGATQTALPFINVGFSGISMMADLKLAHEGFAMIMNTKVITSIGAGLVAMRTMTLTQMLQAGATGVVSAATSVATAAQWAWNAALDANPIGIVIMAIAALVGAVVWMTNHWEGVTAYLSGMWESWKIGFNGIVEVVRTVFGAVVDIVQGTWKVIQSEFTMGTEGAMMKVQGLMQIARGGKAATTGVATIMVETAVKKQVAEARAVTQAVIIDQAAQDKKQKAEAQANMPVPPPAVVPQVLTLDAPRVKGEANPLDATLYHTDLGAAGQLGGKGRGKGSKDNDGVTVGGGSGSGGGDRTISMNITMNNRFDTKGGSDGNVSNVVDQVVTQLVNKLRDAQFALG